MRTNDEIAAVCRNTSEQDWDDAANDFLIALTQKARDMATSTLRRIASGRGEMSTITDVTQVFLLEAYALLLAERKAPGSITELGHSFDAILMQRGRNKVREMLDRETSGSGTGAISAARRRRYLGQCRADLFAQLRREPTAAELVGYANMKAQRDRKDAAKQSLSFTLNDAQQLAHGLETHLGADSAGHESAQVLEATAFTPAEFTHEGLMHEVESANFVEEVAKASEKVSPNCALVARAWLGAYSTDGDMRYLRSTQEIADLCGLNTKQVYRQQIAVRAIAKSVLARRYSSAELSDYAGAGV